MIDTNLYRHICKLMYFELDRQGAIKRLWKRNKSIAQIELIAAEVFEENRKHIEIMERIQRHK